MFQPQRSALAGAATALSALTGLAMAGPASAAAGWSVGFNEPSVNGGVQQGMILRWNGSTWSADTDPAAGTFSPLYGAATLPGATREWAAGINGTDQALIVSHG